MKTKIKLYKIKNILYNIPKMNKYILRIIPNNEEICEFYKNHSHYNEGDSGIDLFCTENITIQPGETKQIKFNISCEMVCVDNLGKVSNISYFMFPRSSIALLPIRLANAVGIIDCFFRGNLSAVVDNIKTYDYQVKKGDRLFQICTPSLTPIHHIEVVKEFLNPEKARGEGYGNDSYGSTGK